MGEGTEESLFDPPELPACQRAAVQPICDTEAEK